MTEPTIEEFYVEDRTFPPPPDFVAGALLTDSSHHKIGWGWAGIFPQTLAIA